MQDETTAEVTDTGDATPETPASPPARAKRGPKPKAAETVEAPPAPAVPGEKSFDCWLSVKGKQDKAFRREVVRAVTAADAREKYMAKMGIRRTEHKIEAVEV